MVDTCLKLCNWACEALITCQEDFNFVNAVRVHLYTTADGVRWGRKPEGLSKIWIWQALLLVCHPAVCFARSHKVKLARGSIERVKVRQIGQQHFIRWDRSLCLSVHICLMQQDDDQRQEYALRGTQYMLTCHALLKSYAHDSMYSTFCHLNYRLQTASSLGSTALWLCKLKILTECSACHYFHKIYLHESDVCFKKTANREYKRITEICILCE